MKKLILPSIVAMWMALVAPSVANALTISVDPTPTITDLGGGQYLWEYEMTLTGDSTITSGDLFTIFDFDGYVAASQSTNTDWSGSTANLGVCPADVLTQAICAGADGATILNLTWTYTGAPLPNPDPSTPLSLGTFSAISIYNTPINDAWVSQDDDDQTGTPNEGAFGNTNVPLATPLDTPVPEPGSMLLLGTGLVGLGASVKRRLRRK